MRTLSSKPQKLPDSATAGVARTLFISDLHLCETRPEITRVFLEFLATTASGAQALYILGDLFEYWAGDDALETDAHHREVVNGLCALTESGTPVFVMHGNRDLLLNGKFQAASGVRLLPDPVTINLYGRQALLTHGDLLCTDDVEYQAFRRQVHDADWQANFLAQPLALRKAQIEGLRQRSEQEKSHKSSVIMDVNADAVADFICQHNFPPLLIHGHTHRMGRHTFEVQGRPCERIVLGDWYASGNYLECTMTGCEFVACSPPR